MIYPQMKILVPTAGLAASILDAATGEVIGLLPLEAGIHTGRKFLEWQSEFTSIDFPPSVMVMSPPPVVNIQHGPAHDQSAAAVDFKPRVITEFERRMERQLQLQNAAIARMIAEHKANNAGEPPKVPLASEEEDQGETPPEPETPAPEAAPNV